MDIISAYIEGQKYSDKVRNAVRYGYQYRKYAEQYEDESSHACLGEAPDVLLWLANLIITGVAWDVIKATVKVLYRAFMQKGKKWDEETVTILKEEENLKVFYGMVVEFNEHRLTVSEVQLKYIREEIIADYFDNEVSKIWGREKQLPTIEEYKRIHREAVLYADELLKKK